MTVARSKMLGASVVLYNDTADFVGAGGDVSGWRNPRDGTGPRDGVITFANVGLQSVSLANPRLVVNNGVADIDMGALFPGVNPVVIAAGAKKGCLVPQHALAAGGTWKVTGTPTSGGTVVLDVTADALLVDE